MPNVFRVLSTSPAALNGYVGLANSLSHGTLSPQTRERIALAVAEINACEYSLSRHSVAGKESARLDDTEIKANRSGRSNDVRADAAVRFAAKLVHERGHVDDKDVQGLKSAGYDDAQVIEIVMHVATNTLMNYINEVAKTDIDFPVVTVRKNAVN